MDSVVHFELPYNNRARMQKFYRSSFGWKTEAFGEEMGDYVLATTTETDENGPKNPGAINGGFYPKVKGQPEQYPLITIAVGDIKKTMEKVKKAGGKVLGQPIDIPGIGKYVSCKDTEGNRVTLLQPLPRNVKASKPKAKK